MARLMNYEFREATQRARLPGPGGPSAPAALTGANEANEARRLRASGGCAATALFIMDYIRPLAAAPAEVRARLPGHAKFV